MVKSVKVSVYDMMYELAKPLPEEYRGEYSDMSKATGNLLCKVESGVISNGKNFVSIPVTNLE